MAIASSYFGGSTTWHRKKEYNEGSVTLTSEVSFFLVSPSKTSLVGCLQIGGTMYLVCDSNGKEGLYPSHGAAKITETMSLVHDNNGRDGSFPSPASKQWHSSMIIMGETDPSSPQHPNNGTRP